VAIPLSKYYDNYYSKNLDLCSKVDWILNKKNEQFDNAFIGSSRVFNMIDIKMFEQKTNSKSINIGTSGSSFAENYLLLYKFIKNNNKIKQLFLQIDIYCLDTKVAYKYPFHDYNFLPYMNDSVVANIMKDNVSIIKYLTWKHVPFAKYIAFSNFYPLYKTFKGGFNCSTSDFDITMGSRLETDLNYKNFRVKSKKNYSVSSIDLLYLDKIIDFTSKHDIDLILYSAPERKSYHKHQLNRIELLNLIKTRTKQEIISFESDTTFNNDDYFRDDTHLNSKGTMVFTDIFSKKVQQLLTIGALEKR